MINGLKNVQILTEEGLIKGNITFEGGLIKEIGNPFVSNPLKVDKLVYIIPGFIDMHVHGVKGYDVMDGTVKSITGIGKHLTEEGTTSFLPTTMTLDNASIEKALKAITNVKQSDDYQGAEIIGVHLEGPFINEAMAGAQPVKYVQDPSVEQFKRFNEVSNDLIKIVTLAPEKDNDFALTKYLASLNIIPSIGHTKANYQTIKESIDAGAKSLTHCFNAMTPLHHRDVGAVGAALLHKDLHAELILDLIHVSHEAANILYQAKAGNHLSLITDSMRAKQLGEGEYDLGGQNVTVKGLKATLEDGTLAGSVLPMIEAYKNAIKTFNIDLLKASQLASLNPAIQLGIADKKGSIKTGKDADLILLDKELNLLGTICKGQLVYRRHEHEN